MEPTVQFTVQPRVVVFVDSTQRTWAVNVSIVQSAVAYGNKVDAIFNTGYTETYEFATTQQAAGVVSFMGRM